MTSGYRAFFDIFMEKSRKIISDAEFVRFGYGAFFLTFSWKNLYKNDTGCLIPDIWVSGLPRQFPCKNDIGSFIRDIWVSSCF